MRAARVLALLVALLATALVAPPAAAARDCGRPAPHLTVAALGDIIDTDSRHRRVFDALCRSQWDKVVTLGDQVHKNAPEFLWRREWVPTYGSLPTCQVWSVLGNHEWGWSKRGTRWSPAARGATYRQFRADFINRCPSKHRDAYQWVKRAPGWVLVGLNSETCTAATAMLTKALRTTSAKRSVAVFYHRPLTRPPGSRAPSYSCAGLQQVFDRSPRIKIVANGHSHTQWTQFRRGTRYIVAGSGGSSGPLGWATITLRKNGTYSWSFRRL